ncbi:GNAT family N-acetyltransferase [Nocardiopsis sp. N85]|uniref:GNAT family N-acetyltransferase n=1 Tax=Nocardiopsis sp. N85 TaxID=3029400 RepID=UPI00237FC93B|nr:GNAT family N-acetyltransferase [Nocardiopsis sp. N85]MDE3722869.1 GNAT family N-acetyltransferase [Nocardiopsis sp. N85]
MTTSDRRTTEWTVRGTDREEYGEAARVIGEALLVGEDPDTVLERVRPIHDFEGYERVRVAVDDTGGTERVIGSTNHFPFEMHLPGGLRPVAGVTGVGVWPTYRRRGVLSSLMRRQLADLHEVGGRYAALWASEGAIYGRFGYGPAVAETEAWVERPHAALRPDAPRDPDLTVHLAHSSEVRADLEAVHGEVVRTRLGQISRTAPWWDRALRDKPEERGGKGRQLAVVVRGPRGPVGYALYRTTGKWESGGPQGTLHVQEVRATVPAAWTLLYEHLLDRDLIARIEFEFMAVDDPLVHLLANPDRLVREIFTSLWVRLVDVPGALAERTYTAPVETVLAVTDRYAPWNAGTWSLKAGLEGARVEATDAAPDVSLDVAHLGAAYLGRTTLTGYAAAGLATEHTPGALARLDAALYRPDAAFNGVIF